jgi:inorganic pyrophosphatase
VVELSCYVEVPQGSRNKYEYDEEAGVLRLDRHVFASVVFPADYGFVEGTRTEDGRHVDALVLLSEPTFPGCRIDARPIGIFQMRDEAGVDDKVLCVPLHDQEWKDVQELDDVSDRVREEIEHFFSVYKDLEPTKVTAIEGWADRDAAERELKDALERYAQQKNGG